MFKDFYDHSSFLKSLNNTFLVLIPKKSGAEDLRDFRPISLLGGLYKLLAKVLANRLKKVVGKVVSTSQNAFVKGRQILDASLIANEVIDTWQKQKEKGIICKLDIEKAYDSINWKFLVKCYKRWDSGPNGWGGCGVAYRQLNFQCWLMECLQVSSLALKALDKGIRCLLTSSSWGWKCLMCLSGELWRGGQKGSSNLLGVDLFWFEAASGLRINLAKSEVIPVGEAAPNRAPYIWDGVEERVRRRLALWKRQYISKGGRVTLIKSTLASMPIYQMSIFRMPKVVVRRIEKVQRDFLWGGGTWREKCIWLNGEVVCTDKDKGGLGLRKLALLNKALLGKWIWRKGQHDMLFGQMCGAQTLHWLNVSLISLGMAAHQSLTVEEMWDQNSGQGNWNLHFLRDFNDWEIELVGEFLHILRGLNLLWRKIQLFGEKGRSGPV
ncbi:putative ribonuclease H protein [Vitis vinifera]|uniref:Putative ribonuclease H protein n=1 Tax=Vitis vinifera TaxID=29760 RepID=A0A438HDG8_VITVI|nr:putative ribonuclease H protein [Vitis vinifera]